MRENPPSQTSIVEIRGRRAHTKEKRARDHRYVGTGRINEMRNDPKLAAARWPPSVRSKAPTRIGRNLGERPKTGCNVYAAWAQCRRVLVCVCVRVQLNNWQGFKKVSALMRKTSPTNGRNRQTQPNRSAHFQCQAAERSIYRAHTHARKVACTKKNLRTDESDRTK